MPMIEDDDLRSLYLSTSEGRLQALNAGFLRVENAPPLSESLEGLRREAHSLKGDSLVMGLEGISTLAQCVEQVAKALYQREIEWTPQLRGCIEEGLQTIEVLVKVATAETTTEATIETNEEGAAPTAHLETGTHLETHIEQLVEQLRQAIAISPTATASPTKATHTHTADNPHLIEDVELREVYGSTAQERLRLIRQSVNQLAVSQPSVNQSSVNQFSANQSSTNQSSTEPNIDALTTLKREAHSLKGDSRAVGVETVAAFMRQFELVAKQALANESSISPIGSALCDCLMRSAQHTTQLVQASVTPTAQRVDETVSEQLLQELTQQIDELATSAGSAESMPTEAPQAWIQPTEFIEDVELRELYQATSAGRLQHLTTELERLEQATDSAEPEQTSSQAAALSALLQEVHSLKGDARSVQVESVVVLAQALERSLGELQHQSITLTPELSEALRHIFSAIDDSVQAATTEAERNVVVHEVIENLRAIAEQAKPTEPTTAVALKPDAQRVPPAAVLSVEAAEEEKEKEKEEEETEEAQTQAEPVGVSAIADQELRDIYRATSVERIQRIEVGLVQLEKQPDNEDILAELLRETHSLKGDASSVGLEDIEALSHAMEDVLTQVQYPQQPLTSAAGDVLYEGLDAISQLVQEAITGVVTKPVDTPQLLQQLQGIRLLPTAFGQPETAQIEGTSQPIADAADSETALADDLSDTLQENSLSTSPSANQSDRTSDPSDSTETIRVQTRDLDALAAQTEQLTLTRLQIAETAARLSQLATLWDDWQTYRNRAQSNPSSVAPSGSVERHALERQIDTLMNSLQFAAPESSLKLNAIAQEIEEQVKTLRLLPINHILRQFPRVVRDLSRQQNKSVELVIEGGETTADKKILEGIQDALTHLVRNAIDHGIETTEARIAAGKPATAQLKIRSYQSVNSFVIEISDDGQGLDLETIKQVVLRRKLLSSDKMATLSDSQIQDLIFTPGFSTRSFTTEISGRGVGLDIVRTQVERLKGNIQIDSSPGEGCTFRLQLSTRLTTVNVVMLAVQGVIHALPLEFLRTTLRVAREDITVIAGKATIQWNEQTIPVAELFDVLELANAPSYQQPLDNSGEDPRACIILRVGDELGAFLVDQLLETQEVVFKPQSKVLKRVRNITGATLLSNGEVCMILNPSDLIKSLQRENADAILNPLESFQRQKPLILLVEDSPPVRIQEKRLFERAGYDVVVAKDGLEGYQLLIDGRFDAVVSDVEMPNLDGLSLTAKIRQNPAYEELPIILVTTLSSEKDRQRGAEAGANAYIPKGKFNQAILLETLSRLI
ncbi:MAG: Hpt domain-containing protein [Phormidesmis sp.]